MYVDDLQIYTPVPTSLISTRTTFSKPSIYSTGMLQFLLSSISNSKFIFTLLQCPSFLIVILILDLVNGKIIHTSLKVIFAPFLTSCHIYVSTQLAGPPISPLGGLWNPPSSVSCCSSVSVSF